ncbi:hypothetical protein K5I04_00165 [Murdochiella sp. Marseille-P8839]|nr:hypothetical protein [Murdochiella sp. Marseille-P8839]
MKYHHAIVRKPARSMVEGITTGMFSTETPVYEKALLQHDAYVSALQELGVEVLVLEPLEQYPDSCFVEDPAVVMKECAIVTNSPATTRHGEKQEILVALQKYYPPEQIFALTPPANMEGGDVLQVGKQFYIGLSDRTNAEGVRQFSDIVAPYGYTVIAVPVTEGLHLKDFAVYLDHRDLLVSEVMNEQEAFADFDRFIVPREELYAINSLWINGTVLVPKGNPKTQKHIEEAGYPVKVVDTDEFKKIDGSLTCLSLRF